VTKPETEVKLQVSQADKKSLNGVGRRGRFCEGKFNVLKYHLNM